MIREEKNIVLKVIWFAIIALLLSTEAHAVPPTFSKTFSPDTIGPGSISTLTFSISNDGGTPVDSIAFTDTLPAGMTIATPANVLHDCSDAIVSAPEGGDTISVNSARLAGSSSCTISVNVTSSTIGTHTNTTSALTSSDGSGGTATDDLIVDATLPDFSKSFSPSAINIGQISTLTFDIDNSGRAIRTGVQFTDNLPSGMVVAPIPNASTNCPTGTGQTLTANPGATQVSLYTNGFNLAGYYALEADSTCSVRVDVIAGSAGTLQNVSENLIVDNSISAGKASAILNVSRPSLIKVFTDDPVAPGETVNLQFTLTNFDRNYAATNIAFTDNLDGALSGLAATGLPMSVCGGTLSGASVLNFSGGSLNAEESCTFGVTVAIPQNATFGTYTNTTSTASATVDGSNVVWLAASDDLSVAPVPKLTKTFIDDPVKAGDTVTMRFTIVNPDTTNAMSNITFTDNINAAMDGLTVNTLPSAGFCGGSSSMTQNIISDQWILTMSSGSLAADANCTFDVVLNVPTDATGGNYVNTTSSIGAIVSGTPVTGLGASDTLHVVSAPSLVKYFAQSVSPGDTTTLHFSLSHSPNAPSDATAITFTDDLDAALSGLVSISGTLNDVCGAGSSISGTSTLTFTGGTLALGESCDFNVTVQVPSNAAFGSHTNTTSGISATVDGLTITGPATSAQLKVVGLLFTKSFVESPTFSGNDATLRFRIENTSTVDATSGSFTDSLTTTLSGLSATALPANGFCGGSSSISGTTTLNASNLEINAGSVCEFDATVSIPASASVGTYNNTTNSLTATMDGGGVTIDPATAVLEIVEPLSVTKTFVESVAQPSDTVTMQITLTNEDNATGISNIAFTDDLDAALSGLVATGLPTSVCGGTLSGTSTLSFSGGSLSAGGSCTIDVSLSIPGAVAQGSTLNNTTSSITGTYNSNSFSIAGASAELYINNLLLSKAFSNPGVPGSTVTLSFHIENIGASTVSGLAFNDDLASVLSGMVATGLPQNNVCGAGSVLSGTSNILLSGASLSAGSSCDFDVTVSIPSNATSGTYANTTSNLTASGLPVAEAATANLDITDIPSFSKSFSPSIIGQGSTSTLTFTVDNTANSGYAASSLSFVDNLPTGMTIASTPNASTTCTGGTINAISGASAVSYSGGSVSAGASCTLSVDVTAAVSGTYVNTSGVLSSSLGTTSTATATLTVTEPPLFSKTFTPSSIHPTETSVLTFTIDNSANTVIATTLDFTDNLPSGLVVASTPNASTTCTGGALTATGGSGVVSYSGGSITAGNSCSVSVNVTASVEGNYTNTTNDFTSSLGNSGTATNMLTVSAFIPPNFTKMFSPSSIMVTSTSTLTFTIDNTGSLYPSASLNFTDTLPSGISVASTPNASTTCTGGTLIATAGSGAISYSGGTVSADSSCTISVDVTATAEGNYTNTSGNLTSSLGNSGVAIDTLHVTPIDSDGDGIVDTTEQGPNGTDLNYDGDNNSIPDRLENNVYSTFVNSGSVYITIKTEQPFDIATTTIESISNPSPSDTPSGITFPIGFLNIDVPVDINGHAIVELYLPTGLGINTYWKYTGTPTNTTPHWYEFLYDGTTGAIIEGDKITLHFQDGERGDSDLVADSHIDDQGGPGVHAINVPLFDNVAKFLLSFLLLVLSLHFLRFFRVNL